MGFINADGHLYETKRNRGKLSIELRREDRPLLEELGKISGQSYSIYDRERDTNYKKNYKSSILCIFDLVFRKFIKTLGMVAGKKDRTIKPPEDIIISDYIRGYIDGNGSVGFTAKNVPIISVTTNSDFIKELILKHIQKITGKHKDINRNKRDGVYNIALTAEDAVAYVTSLYNNSTIALERKKTKALKVMSWKRPSYIRRVPNKKFWTTEQDNFILSHNMEESCKKLDRSFRSVQLRLWRLKKNLNNSQNG